MVEIKQVSNKKMLRKFVNFPNVFFKNEKNFIPAFYGDDMSDWNKKKNPAFNYCDAECYLAYKNGKLVGRIGVIISHAANKKFGTKRARFTQVDFINDDEVVDALFDTVEDYARKHGCDEMHGPLGFCDLDREGMLVEGYDERSMFITYYNYPYYIDQLTRRGYVKDVDWVEFKIPAPSDDLDSCKRLERISKFVLKKNNYHIAEVKHRREYKPYLVKFFKLVNEAYADLYSVVDLNPQQIEKYSKKFMPLINPKYACLVMDKDENMVAMGVSAPSVANAIKKSNGKLFPFGWISVLWSLNHSKTLDMFLVAVKPELQGTGVNAVILSYIQKNATKDGIIYAETGPMLETNSKVLAQWELFPKEQHKRRRCFIKKI